MTQLNRVQVEIQPVKTDAQGRQVRSQHKTSEALADRREDIQAAIAEAVSILSSCPTTLGKDSALGLTAVSAKFGIKLTAEAGVIVSRIASEASLEIEITLER